MHFDVTIITSYRVGTDSLCKYMSKHPDIYCPGYYGTKFRYHAYSDKTFTDTIRCKRNVFIWHDSNTDALYNGDVPIKYKYLIHPVRHPYEQMIASYNASLQQDIIYNKDTVDIEKYIMQGNLNSLRCSLSYSSNYCNYEKVKIVDFSNLSSAHINRTMNDIYQWLGVEECAKFDNDPVFKKSHIDTFLEKSPLRISYKGIDWTIYFISQAEFTPKNLYPIGYINTDDFGVLAMCVSKVELYINRTKYHGILAKDIELIIERDFSIWSNELNDKLDLFMMKKINMLPQKIYSLIDDVCKSDYRKIIEYYPEIETLWRDKWI